MPQGGPPNIPPPPAPGTATPGGTSTASKTPDLSLSFGKGPPRGTSAPASPAKSRESLLQRVQSLTGAARDQGASIIGAAVSSATRPTFNKDKCFTLLVLDDQNTDWTKYFRGKRLHGDYDIRVEQAEFREISLTANADTGTMVTMAVYRGGTKVARSFRPDFVLIRQAPRDGSRDFRSTLLGLKYGGVPCINSLNSIYQFQDKPWIFAHLLQLQRRQGRDAFPLIEQTFFPNAKDLFSWQKYPCVLKAGHCHGGAATARLENQSALQDAAGLLTGSSSEVQCYCTLEPYIDAKFDIHIQKIGTNYKAFMRKSISGNWKTNQGSAMLEQIAMTEKYKGWLNELSEMFGGMEVCGLSIAVAKDGREFILGASDSTVQLMGDTQEDDRRQIADIVVSRMQNVCRPQMAKTASRSSISSRGGSPTDENVPPAPAGPRPVSTSGPPPIPERTTPGPGSIGRHGSLSSVSSEPPEQPTEKAPTLSNVGRRDSQASQSSTVSGVSTASRQTPQLKPQGQTSVAEDAEDTMKNLRKTFAGIFDFNEWLRAMKMVARLPGGMPPEFRRKLWLALADQYFQMKAIDWEKEQHKCMCDQSTDDNEELGIQIVKDLHRTGSSLFSGPAGSLNQAKLKRVLIGYARWNPEVGYCQGFNMLGALLLQVMDKEDVESLKVMIFLIEGCLPSGYFNGSLGGLQADMAVFRDLLSARLPKLARHLQRLQGGVQGEGSFEPPLTNVFTMQWFLTLFCTCLPINCVLRVWDLVLIEGSDILLRTALAIWGLLEERILATKTADDFYCKMGMLSGELLNGHLFDSNGLIQKVVDLGPIPELQKLRDKHLYNITPWRDKRGLRIFLSDDDGDSDDDSRLAVTAAWGIRLGRRGSIGLPTTSKQSDGKDRIALDISLLKKQYDKLRERQRQAHIILTNTAKQTVNPSSSNSISVNQYLMGRNAIVSNKGKRLGPPPGSIPPARKPAITKVSKTTPKQTFRVESDIIYSEKKKIKKNVVMESFTESHSNYENYSPKKSSSATSIKSSISDTSLSTPSKSRKRSESSSYSEDSDANSSTSTSLCDDENFEYSSVEASPLKLIANVKDSNETFTESQPNIDECIRSLNLYETDGLENGSDEVITIYDQNSLPTEFAQSTDDGFESIHGADETPGNEFAEPVLTSKDYDDELYGPSCSKMWSLSESFSESSGNTNKKYLQKYDVDLFGRCLSPDSVTPDSPQFDENKLPTIKSESKIEVDDFDDGRTECKPAYPLKQELLIENPLTITSTSQLSPIVDISKYLGNFTISPLRTPSSFLEYSTCDPIQPTITETNNETIYRNYLVSDEGVTNEYFEIINAPERPTRLDLTQSLSNNQTSTDFADYSKPDQIETESSETILETTDIPNKDTENSAEDSKSSYIDVNIMQNSLIQIKELPERMIFIREKSYSLDECSKDKEEFRPTSCPEPRCDKNNTDRISKIIEENSQILHRILQKKLSGDKSEGMDVSVTSDDLIFADDTKESISPIENTFSAVLYKPTDNYDIEVAPTSRVTKDDSNEIDGATYLDDLVPRETSYFNDNKDDMTSQDGKPILDGVTSSVHSTYETSVIGIDKSDSHTSTTDDILKYGIYVPPFESKNLSLDQNYAECTTKVDIKESDLSQTKDISETLSSIKNTIQNIDSLCQEEDRSKCYYGNRKENSYGKNYGNKHLNQRPSTKEISSDFNKTDYLHLRYSRDRSRDVSPRRRLLDDDKIEYESRSRRDISTKQIDSNDSKPISDYSSYIPNLTFNLSNYSPVKSNKFEIRHTTVTSTFYDRFMSQKKERSTKLDKSPSTPVITKEYLESLRPPSKDRNSKSAENSPSRSSTTNDTLLLSAYPSPFGNTSIRSCDNIPANLKKSSDSRSHFHFSTKPKKPSELGIKLGMYKH